MQGLDSKPQSEQNVPQKISLKEVEKRYDVVTTY